MRPLAIALLSIFSSVTTAADSNFFEVGYQQLKFDGADSPAPAGAAITLNQSLGGFYIEGHYSSTSEGQSLQMQNTLDDYSFQSTRVQDIQLRQRSLGVGKVVWLSHASYIDMSYSQTDFEVKNKSRAENTVNDADGTNFSSQQLTERSSVKIQALDVGYYFRFNSGITTETGLGFEKVKGETTDTNFVWFAGLNYDFTRNWAGKVNIRDAEVYRELTASVVYQF